MDFIFPIIISYIKVIRCLWYGEFVLGVLNQKIFDKIWQEGSTIASPYFLVSKGDVNFDLNKVWVIFCKKTEMKFNTHFYSMHNKT